MTDAFFQTLKTIGGIIMTTKAQEREEAMIDGILEIFYDTKSKAAERFLIKDFEESIGKAIENLVNYLEKDKRGVKNLLLFFLRAL